MKPETKGKVMFGLGGLICGLIITIIVGFKLGGWTTAGTTQKMIDEAVLKSQASICVAQFMAQPNSEEKLKEFIAIEYHDRDEFIVKGGWHKMPGQQEGDPSVAVECTERLQALHFQKKN
jgi:hypothetical protein